MGKVIHIDGAGGGGTGQGYIGIFTNYNDLITQYPTAPLLSLAYVENSQGTPWLPGSLLGTFYSKGTYLWNGLEWSSDVDEIAKALEDINNEIAALGLPEVLAVDSTTGANDISVDKPQIIKSSLGVSYIDMASGLNNNIDAVADGGVFLQGGNFIDEINTSAFVVNPTGTSMGVFKNDGLKYGTISVVGNSENDVLGFDTPNYPVNLSAQDFIIRQNIYNSIILGGNDIIAKSNNTAYLNQLGFHKAKELFETIVKHVTPTQDNLIQFPNKSGFAALISDIPQGLSETLAISDIMQDVDRIKSTDGKTEMQISTLGAGLQYGTIGVNHVSVLDVSDGQAQFFLFSPTFTRGGGFGLFQNDALRDFNAGAIDSYPSRISCKGGILNQDVKNSVQIGGNSTIVKTDETAYCNQLAFNTGEAFETLVNYATPTQDNLVEIPNKSGVFALTNDILKTKSGEVLNATFAGNPKVATVTFATPFADNNYSIALTSKTILNTTYTPKVNSLTKTANGFTINMGVNNIASLVSCMWVATEFGEN